MSKNQIIDQQQYLKLQQDIAKILNEAKETLQNATNRILAESYWRIGQRISSENLSKNANYNNLTLRNLEQDLQVNKNVLGKSIQLYLTYPDGLQENLSWSHYCQLVTIKDSSSRESLTKQATQESWSVRQLETSIKKLNSPEKSPSLNKIKRPTDPSYLYMAKIIDVVDGDTLILHIDLGFDVIKKQRVRLTQINAPEIKTAKGRKSMQYLRDLCARIEAVAIKTNKVDIYGRFLGDIFYLEGDLKQGTTQGDIFEKGIYLNEKLVKAGVAELI